MARPLCIEFPGAIYHVTARGDRREAIFDDDADRETLLEVLGRTLARFDGCVLAYCLMGNHYHLVLHTRRANLSRIMRDVNGIYTQAYSRRHGGVLRAVIHAQGKAAPRHRGRLAPNSSWSPWAIGCKAAKRLPILTVWMPTQQASK